MPPSPGCRVRAGSTSPEAPGRGPAAGSLILQLAGLIVALASTAQISTAAPGVEATLTLMGGHDNQILADPEGVGYVSPVAAGLATISGRLSLLWTDAARRRRFDLAGEASRTAYGSDGPVGDTDLKAEAFYRHALGSSSALEVALGAGRFRRDGIPLFDLDLVETGIRCVSEAGGPWRIGLGGAFRRPSFPGRIISGSSTETQRDSQGDLTAFCSRRLGISGWALLEAGWRRSESTDSVFTYSGPITTLYVSGGTAGQTHLGAYAAFNRRSYDGYPVLSGARPTGEIRRDTTWRLGVAAERSVTMRSLLVVELGWTRQISNVEGIGFDQTRIAGGVRLHLAGSGVRGAPSPGERPTTTGLMPGLADKDQPPDSTGTGDRSLAPQRLAEGIQFQVWAPDAESVALAGGFNGWDLHRHPLKGPDPAGIWEVVIPVPPGIWRYVFVIDGTWLPPPGADAYEEDGFGGTVGVLVVDPGMH